MSRSSKALSTPPIKVFFTRAPRSQSTWYRYISNTPVWPKYRTPYLTTTTVLLLLPFILSRTVNPFNHPRLSSPSAGLHPSFLLIVGLTYLRSQGVFATVGSPDLETHRPSPPLASRSIVLVFKTGSFWIDALNIPYHRIVWTQPSVVLAFLGTLDDR